MCECVVDAFGGAYEEPTGEGRGRDSTRNESGLEREMNMTSRREIPFP